MRRLISVQIQAVMLLKIHERQVPDLSHVLDNSFSKQVGKTKIMYE